MRIMIAHAGYDELKAMLWPFLMPPPTSARRSPRVVFAFVAGLFTVSATSSSMGESYATWLEAMRGDIV